MLFTWTIWKLLLLLCIIQTTYTIHILHSIYLCFSNINNVFYNYHPFDTCAAQFSIYFIGKCTLQNDDIDFNLSFHFITSYTLYHTACRLQPLTSKIDIKIVTRLYNHKKVVLFVIIIIAGNVLYACMQCMLFFFTNVNTFLHSSIAMCTLK